MRQHLIFTCNVDLDELSLWLRADEQYGQAVLFFLIFLTTIRTSLNLCLFPRKPITECRLHDSYPSI